MKGLNKRKSTKEKTIDPKRAGGGPASIDPRILQAALQGVDEPVGVLAGRK